LKDGVLEIILLHFPILNTSYCKTGRVKFFAFNYSSNGINPSRWDRNKLYSEQIWSAL